MENKRKKNFVFLILGLFCVSLVITGCEPLRKKFTRQKKSEQRLVQEPVLDPIDYPQKVYDALGDYRYRFSLFHVWKKEFIKSIDDQASPKRLRYLMDNMIEQLVSMNRLIVEQKRTDLEQAIKELKGIRSQLDMPPQFYDFPNMRRRVNTITQHVRSVYRLSEIERYIMIQAE